MTGHLYIHVPFCRRKCTYCNFYSVPYDQALAASYIEALSAQAGRLTGKFSSIYVGGGTPSVIGPKLFRMLLSGLKERADKNCEFTVEANPESLDNDILSALVEGGVNRLSIGVQSTIGKKLKSLGRIHDYNRAKQAVSSAARKGFKNISVDLIFGMWDETLDLWKKDLEEAVRLPVTHVSCYELTYEKGTPLYSMLRNNSILAVDDDITSRMYELAIDTLSLRGFKQYEVSNFARGGYESRHNLNYWENGSYVGLGASAFSYIDGVRSRNVSSVTGFLKLYNSGKPLVDFSEKLPPLRAAKETAAVKIRTKDGIDFDWFRQKTGYDFLELEKKALPRLMEDGLVKYKRQGDSTTGICLLRKGFLHCDTVSSALL